VFDVDLAGALLTRAGRSYLVPENDGALAYAGGERLVEVELEVGDDETEEVVP
jgi:hypothetical protein